MIEELTETAHPDYPEAEAFLAASTMENSSSPAHEGSPAPLPEKPVPVGAKVIKLPEAGLLPDKQVDFLQLMIQFQKQQVIGTNQSIDLWMLTKEFTGRLRVIIPVQLRQMPLRQTVFVAQAPILLILPMIWRADIGQISDVMIDQQLFGSRIACRDVIVINIAIVLVPLGMTDYHKIIAMLAQIGRYWIMFQRIEQ